MAKTAALIELEDDPKLTELEHKYIGKKLDHDTDTSEFSRIIRDIVFSADPVGHFEARTERVKADGSELTGDTRRAEKYIGLGPAYASIDPLIATFEERQRRGEQRSKKRKNAPAEYRVESLVRTRGTGDDVEVEVRWAGYSELTWEPLASVAHLTTLIATLT